MADYWEGLAEPRNVCYSRDMTNDTQPTFTTAQVFDTIATTMENAVVAIREAETAAEALAILQARAAGARELADVANQ